MHKDRVLVPWSGGMDSTFLIWQLLASGQKVQEVYINLTNNSIKTEMEKRARERLIPVFKDLFKHSYDVNSSYESTFNINHGPLMDMKQNCIWLLALAYTCNHDTQSVQMGYIMNDCTLSYLDEMKQTWAALNRFANGKLPPLQFPIIKWNKAQIKETLPAQLFEHIWYCENPVDNKPCHDCDTCKRHDAIDPLAKPASGQKVEDIKVLELT